MNTTTRRFTTDILNDPFFVGFDRIFDRMHAMNRSGNNASNYPPYNLINSGDDTYLIEIAVAGFSEKDFDIELHDGVLRITGKVETAAEDTKTYLHKGIAARSFRQEFTLADTIVVEDVSLTQGMLVVKLRNEIPEEKKPRKIEISTEPELLIG